MALILGESHDSGQDSGWDGNGKKTTIPNEFRESSWRVSRSEFRADNGRFCEMECSLNRSCGARCSVQYPLPFSREDL